MNTWIGFAGPQDPIYGIRRKNLVERLTAANWTTKALLRKVGDLLLYIWITRDGLSENPLERKGAFRVNVVSLPEGDAREIEAEHSTLEAALAYANGEDDGRIARETRPVPVEGWQAVRPAGVTLSPTSRRMAPRSDRV
jgi:hypothetical protein